MICTPISYIGSPLSNHVLLRKANPFNNNTVLLYSSQSNCYRWLTAFEIESTAIQWTVRPNQQPTKNRIYTWYIQLCNKSFFQELSDQRRHSGKKHYPLWHNMWKVVCCWRYSVDAPEEPPAGEKPFSCDLSDMSFATRTT